MDPLANFDALDVQVWTAAPSGLLTFVNTFTARYFGMSREQLVGEGWQNVLHSADLAAAVAAWTKSLESGEPYRVNFRLLRASDRVYRWHRASAQRVVTPEGTYWLGTNVDIDAERRAEEALAFQKRMSATDTQG